MICQYNYMNTANTTAARSAPTVVYDAIDNEVFTVADGWDAFDLCLAAWNNRAIYAEGAGITVEEFEAAMIEEHPSLEAELRAGHRF